MKKSKPITARLEFDFKNPKVQKWFKEKSKVKKLEDITFEEILNECPEALQSKKVQVLSTEGQKWHISPLEDKPEITILRLFDQYDINTKKILDILNKGFYPQTAFLDVVKDAQGGKLNLIDGHFTEFYSQIQEQLKDKLKDDNFKTHERKINKLTNHLEKEKTKAKMSRKVTITESNPYTSSTQMVGYQALHLYEYLRKTKKLKNLSDRKLYAVIADLLNLRYQVKKYKWNIIKTYIENAIEHREKIKK